MNKFYFVFISLVVLLGVFVFAQTPFNSVVVNANSCFENDGGLNYFVPGFVNGSFWWATGNGTNSTQTFNGMVSDVCLNNNTLFESVCGSSISSSYSNLAGILYVNCANGCMNGACRSPTNNTNGTGRDLIVSNIGFSYFVNGTINVNGTNLTTYNVMVNATVRNVGNIASGNSTTRIAFKTHGWPFTTVNRDIPIGSLGAGQGVVVLRAFSGYSGQFTINATADIFNTVNEVNELNNVLIIGNYLP